MIRTAFYSLTPDSRGDRFLLTCRLVERIRATDLRILVYCPEREQAMYLDRFLWTYRQDSFLPHGLVEHADPAFTPVLIGDPGNAPHDSQVLINLSLEIPRFAERFARLCEPIDHDPAVRTAGRERFRAYRERGYPLEHHSVRL